MVAILPCTWTLHSVNKSCKAEEYDKKQIFSCQNSKGIPLEEGRENWGASDPPA